MWAFWTMFRCKLKHFIVSLSIIWNNSSPRIIYVIKSTWLVHNQNEQHLFDGLWCWTISEISLREHFSHIWHFKKACLTRWFALLIEMTSNQTKVSRCNNLMKKKRWECELSAVRTTSERREKNHLSFK